MDGYKIHGIESKDVEDYVKNHSKIDPLHIKEDSRKNLLMTACTCGDDDLVRSCLNIDVDCSNPKLLENAAYYGYYEIVKMLLENGADPTNGGCWSVKISNIRGHYKTSKLINQYLRRYKLNQLMKNE